MNKTSITLATLALLAATGPALAQSSVTLFGIVDLAARSVKNDTSQKQLAGSGLSSSRLGFRGVEDLGGGLKAGFWLEGALTADDGNASGFNFQRRSTVSLMGGFGELRLGRDKVPTQLNWDAFDPFDNTGMGANTRLSVASGILPTGGSFGAFSRANNMISYLTPTVGGIFGQASVAAGEGTPGNKHMGLRAGYNGGGLLAAVGYGNTEVTGAIDAKEINFGASYDLKFMKLIGFISQLDIGPASQDNWLVGATVPLGSFTLRASYSEMDGKEAIAVRDAKMFALGGVYTLSKRTALYATFSKISNTNTNFTVATGSALTRGNDSSGYDFGIRHAF
ncbi:MAG: porin [Rubrivivax sp.]|nr:porin [Rubrivivax sp.]